MTSWQRLRARDQIPGQHLSSVGSCPGRKKDADDPFLSSPACPHTCVHSVVLRFTAREIFWHDRSAILGGHGELRQASCLSLLCEGPGLNRGTVLRMAAFFRIPVVRASRRHQTRNARGENETCPGSRQTASCKLRGIRHQKPKSRCCLDRGLRLEQQRQGFSSERLCSEPRKRAARAANCQTA